MRNTLCIIPARGGSKGIPGKNIKKLNGTVPLIHFSIRTAKQLFSDADICLTTDDDAIIEEAQRAGLKVPFKRPSELATDAAGSYEVITHALDYYQALGKTYEMVLLLQPTSPFRKVKDIKAMVDLLTEDVDMVVSVFKSHHNPYFSLFEENEEGFLQKSKSGYFERRQDAPNVYAYNGSAYLIKTDSLRKSPLHMLKRVKKYVMDEIHSIDIDTPLDWIFAEAIITNGLYKYEND